MSLPRASVVIVSRHRAAALRRCVLALRQSDHPQMELIVVADPAGLAALGDGPWKTVAFDVPNISAARNLGLDVAAGDVVAFLDDDAVPEPTWLSRLAAVFADPRVAAAGGFVRGRNGISYQWRAMEVDRTGADHPLEIAGSGPVLRAGDATRAVKTQGTNCAFRRSALMQIGGFDPAYAFYLDEADVNLRLAAQGHLTAIVPGAEVHHGFLESAHRAADRTPLTLFDIGASSAVFLRRHAPEAEWHPALDRVRREQAARLAGHAARGRLNPTQIRALTETLEAGITAGLGRALDGLAPRTDALPPFLALPGTGPRPGCLLAGRVWSRKRLAAEATRRAGQEIVTVLCLSPTARPHRMRFAEGGYWEQSGGLFGRSDRTGPRLRWRSFARRVRDEAVRLARVRPIDRTPAG